jgi:hypothetical protein
VHGPEFALLLVGVACLEFARDCEVLAHLDPDALAGVDAHEAVEDGLDLLLVGNLDHEGGRQLTRPRQERAVDVDLVLDPGVVGDALHATHLLDLKEERVAVLEHE